MTLYYLWKKSAMLKACERSSQQNTYFYFIINVLKSTHESKLKEGPIS